MADLKRAEAHIPEGRGRFLLPATPAEADQLNDELGKLATATEWRRSAIVYSRVCVRERQGRPTTENLKVEGMSSPDEYAKLGIYGLRSPQSIRRYWRAWQKAIDDGLAQPVKLGDDIELPDAAWHDYYGAAVHHAPPYYVPPDPAMQDEDEEGEQLELGTCPPMASNVEEGIAAIAAERAAEPAHSAPDFRPRRRGRGGSQLFLPRPQFFLGNAERSTECALRYAKGDITDSDAAATMERIERIRTLLTEIEDVMRRRRQRPTDELRDAREPAAQNDLSDDRAVRDTP